MAPREENADRLTAHQHREAARLRQAMAPTLGDQAAIREWRIEADELSAKTKSR